MAGCIAKAMILRRDRLDFVPREWAEPFPPARPPRPMQFIGIGKPATRIFRHFVIHPMLILFRTWWINHASNMTGAGQREADIAAKILRTFIDRMPRADMVGSAGLNKDRDLDIAHVHRLAEHFEFAA